MATESKRPDPLPPTPSAGPPNMGRWRWMLLILGGVLLAQYLLSQSLRPREIAYTEFIQRVEAGEVEAVQIGSGSLTVQLTRDAKGVEKREDGQAAVVKVGRLPGIDETKLVDELKQKGVRLRGDIDEDPGWLSFALIWLLPLLLMGLLYTSMMRSAMSGGGPRGPLSFGRSRAKIHDQSAANPVRFLDVAGQDEAKSELGEVVDFLRLPRKYRDLGARIPRGVLLVGSPGTGKTLMARAVAGEAGVPFFSLSGSDFVEMFVGVGAARVRDLFQQAKERSPCIVFIDELDAIGKSRGGVGAMATHDEREQTLNQLLTEMDGFDPHDDVIIMAATNRPEVLDQALLRAGRFDRQVVLDRPDLAGREAILRVHVRRVPLDDGVHLRTIAQRTPGMSGADLANVVNEAALCAARRTHTKVMSGDFEEAVDRLQLGMKKQGRAMNEEEKRRVAFHEAGHALVAMHLPHADPVHRVTIIPRTVGALGATLQLPTEDRYLVTVSELRDKLAVMMGGRTAEKLVCHEVSTGAQNDLERATETARQMVTRFGMSEELGPQTYGRSLNMRYLDGTGAEDRNYSETTSRAIDAEIRAIMNEAEQRAQQILRDHEPELSAIVERLLEDETLERETLLDLVQPSDAAAEA